MANILDDKKKNEPVVGAVSPAPIASASTAPVAAPVAAPAQYTPTPIQRASVSMPVDRAWRSPADRSMNQARDWAAQQSVGVNQQLQMHRNEMGTTNTSLTQLAARLDPSVLADTERRRQWRMMTPQQRRAEVDALALQQAARIADSATPGGWNDVTAYSRDIADPSGTFVDSYGRNTQIYSPEAQMIMRQHQRNIDKEVGEMLSNFDRTSWSDPQSMREAFASLKSVQDAGDFGKAYVFNLMRRYSSPQMRAQMEAEDRNKRLFEDWGITEGAKAIAEFQARNPGIPVTANGTRDIMGSIYLHREDDPASAAVWQMFLDSTPTLFTAMNGKTVVDPAQMPRYEQAQARLAEEKAAQKQSDDIAAKGLETDRLIEAIRKVNPQYAEGLTKNDRTGELVDLNQYKQETNWDEIYKNDARIAATESLLSWGRFHTEEEAATEAARQFPLPAIDPNDPKYQAVLAQQQQAVDIWRTQVNPPEKRAELERELYNLKLRGQELRKGFKSPPAPEPTSGGYDLTMDLLGFGNQANRDQSQTPPSITHNPASQSQSAVASSGRVGVSYTDSLSPDQIEEYEKTGKLVLNEEQLGNKVPVLVKRKGHKRKVELLSPDEVIQIAKTSVMFVRVPNIETVNLDKKTIDAIRNQLNKESPLGPPKEPYSDHYVKWYWAQKMRKYYEAVVKKANDEKYFA